MKRFVLFAVVAMVGSVVTFVAIPEEKMLWQAKTRAGDEVGVLIVGPRFMDGRDMFLVRRSAGHEIQRTPILISLDWGSVGNFVSAQLEGDSHVTIQFARDQLPKEITFDLHPIAYSVEELFKERL